MKEKLNELMDKMLLSWYVDDEICRDSELDYIDLDGENQIIEWLELQLVREITGKSEKECQEMAFDMMEQSFKEYEGREGLFAKFNIQD